MTVEKVITSIVLAFAAAQITKFFVNKKETGKWIASSFIQTGGMPSSHTSSTVALSTALFIETGWSYYFVIAAMFTIIVMIDAMKVRRQTGEEAKALNIVMKKMEIFHVKFNELVGHTPSQVVIGFFVGIVSALVVYAF